MTLLPSSKVLNIVYSAPVSLPGREAGVKYISETINEKYGREAATILPQQVPSTMWVRNWIDSTKRTAPFGCCSFFVDRDVERSIK